MNTPVKFEIAKLLKEKGFDNESAHYYNEKGEMLFDAYYPSLQPTKPDVYYDNPTIADVVMWLYDEHGIWIKIGFSGDETCYLMITNKTGDIRWNEKGCSSPTEAYEAAIFYVLSNLI